jgi:ATP-dependent Clp protease ATP-binding subunit ClpB
MQPDKFTMKTQAALQSAQAIAHERSHQEIDGEHLLLAILQPEDSLIPPLLQKLGLSYVGSARLMAFFALGHW